MNKRRTSKAFRVRATMTLLLLLLTSTTAWAADGVKYIDGNGEHVYKTTATIAENAITDLENGWYVISGNYSSSQTLTFTGDVNLILADDADGTITGANGIVVYGNLTIYGQSQGTGSLSVKATGHGGDGIYASGSISIIGGIITATSDNQHGITNDSGDITIIGGKVTANGDKYGIYASNGNIILGYTNDTDRISANSYEVAGDNSNSISISNGKTMIDGENTYTYNDKLTASNINNKILAPNLFNISNENDGSSSSKPYIINSTAGLQLLATYVNSGTICVSESSTNNIFYVYKDKYFTLNDDIAFIPTIGNNFTPIGGGSGKYYAFCGSFNGNNHMISGINIDIDDNSYAGIFGYVEDGASISNVTLVNASIRGNEFIGGIVGEKKGGSISNCLVANSRIIKSTTGENYIGVITGSNSGSLDYNYYGNSTVKVNDENISSGIGCGTASGSSDVTTNDGAVSATFLTDSEPVPSTLSGKVLFYREFTGSKASTICLPFAYTPKNSDGKFYTFDGIKKNGTTYEATMTVVTSTSLNPNMPYLFVPAGNNTIKPVLFHGTAAYDASELTDTKTPWTFIGTYSRLTYGTAPFSDPVYGFAAKTKDVGVQGQEQVEAGEFVRAITGAYIPPMRCFLKYNTTSTRGETEKLPERIIVKLVGDPTSIGTLNTQTGEVTFDGWYSLDGQRFNSKPTKKGLYIYKGIKVTIK